MAVNVETRVLQHMPAARHELAVDICVLGAGIAGVSAAIEAARLGRSVALIDAAPSLGGQSVGSVIGTFCGVYYNGPKAQGRTYGLPSIRQIGWIVGRPAQR